MTNKSRSDKIEAAKIKFPTEFAEWEQCNTELEATRNQLKERGGHSQSLQNEEGKLVVSILLLELAMEINDIESLKPLCGFLDKCGDTKNK